MFHKPNSSTLGGKKDAPLRKSDRRKLRDRLIEALFIGDKSQPVEWISRAESLIDDAIVGGGEVLCRKLRLDGLNVTLFLRTASCDGNEAASSLEMPNITSLEELMNAFPTSWPYHNTTQPILLEYEDSERKLHLIPLLPLLSALPPPPLSPPLTLQSTTTEESTSLRYRIPCITIHAAVSKFICRGASLMKSGIRSFPPPHKLRQSAGLVCVTVIGNPQVMAIGFVEHALFREYCYKKHDDWRHTAFNLVGPDKKGVGVEIVSCYGDDLWKSSLPVKSVEVGVWNPLGGGRYENGQFGNVGFCEGKIVGPILTVEEESVGDDDEDGNVAESSVDVAQENVDVVAANMEQLNVSDVIETEEKKSSDRNENGIQDEKPPEIDHDAILEAAFYTSLIQLLMSKTPLPIPVSTYSAKHLMAAVPPSGPRLDMKQTTHKKIGPFLLQMESHGVIKLGPSKDKKDKCAFLVGIEKQHPDLIAFKRQWKQQMEQNGQDLTTMAGSDTKKKLAVVDLFIIPRHISDGMQLAEEDVKAMNAKTEERKETGFLTKTECRSIIDSYIENESLVDPNSKGKILINGPLCDALYRPSKKNKPQETSYPTSVNRKDLIDQWLSKMDSGHALVEMPGSKILSLSRGQPKPVDIEVEFRQGNKKKFLTRLRGMEEYGIDAEVLSNDVSQRFACSGSVELNPVGRAALKKGRAELVFQGHLSEELTALLTGDEKLSSHGGVKGAEYNLPKSVVKVTLRKGVPARKKH